MTPRCKSVTGANAREPVLHAALPDAGCAATAAPSASRQGGFSKCCTKVPARAAQLSLCGSVFATDWMVPARPGEGAGSTATRLPGESRAARRAFHTGVEAQNAARTAHDLFGSGATPCG